MKSKWVFLSIAVILFLSSAARSDFPLITTTDAEFNYNIVYNSAQDEFMLAFAGSSHFSMLQRISANGTKIGSAIYPWGNFLTIYETAIVYNPHLDEYLVVSVDNGAASSLPGIVAIRLNSSGAIVGSLIRVLFGYHHTVNSSRYINVTFNTLANEYLVTAAMNMGNGLGDVFAQRLSETGAILGSAINLTNGPYSINGHAVAYAPIADQTTPTGRYLLVADNLIRMLDSTGKPIPLVHDPDHGFSYVNVPFVWGSTGGKEYHPDVAYGEILGEKQFLIVWADYNNKDPFDSSKPWTGIWGGYVDATELDYLVSDSVENTSFPISSICQHWANTTGSHWWKPRVLYNAANKNFYTVWRETAGDSVCDDTKLYHIRGNYIDYLYRFPPHANTVISQATGVFPGDQQPQDPAIAVTPSGKILVTWGDHRNSGSGNNQDIYAQFWADSKNDHCDNAQIITEGQTFGTLLGATPDGSAGCGTGQPDVWFRYTAPVEALVKINTCGSIDIGGTDLGVDTILSVHTGCPGTLENEINCNDDWINGNDYQACLGKHQGSYPRDSALAMTLNQGQTILIRVTHFEGTNPGSFFLNLTLTPINDECANASPIAEGSFSFNNINSSTDGPTEAGNCAGVDFGSDIWYSYYPACNGTAVVSLCGSSYDTMLSVYSGSCPSAADQAIICDDDFCGQQSSVVFPVVKGAPYLIRIGGYNGAQGQGEMTIYTNQADINVDCAINLLDFNYIAANWKQTGCVPPTWCGSADINHDGKVDKADLAIIALYWLR